MLPSDPSVVVAGAADFGFVSDSSALAIALRAGNIYRVLALDEMRPTRGNPLKPSAVVERFVDFARPYNITAIWADLHYAESVRELLAPHGIRLVGAPDKSSSYVFTKQLLNEGRLRLPPNPRLLAQLKAIVSKPTSGGGLSISSPRRAGGGHGDLVSAVVLALWAASHAQVPPVPYADEVRNNVQHYHSPIGDGPPDPYAGEGRAIDGAQQEALQRHVDRYMADATRRGLPQ